MTYRLLASGRACRRSWGILPLLSSGHEAGHFFLKRPMVLLEPFSFRDALLVEQHCSAFFLFCSRKDMSKFTEWEKTETGTWICVGEASGLVGVGFLLLAILKSLFHF